VTNKPSNPRGNGPGRDPASGRFLAGNKLGRGSPLAGQAARLRAELLGAVKPADLRRIVAAMIQRALGGDVAAAKLVLTYALGEPQPWDLIARIETLEAALEGREQ